MYNEDNKLITTEGGVVNVPALTLTLTSPFTIGRVKYTKTRSFYLAGLPPDLANRLNTNRRFEIGPTWIRKLDQKLSWGKNCKPQTSRRLVFGTLSRVIFY